MMLQHSVDAQSQIPLQNVIGDSVDLVCVKGNELWYFSDILPFLHTSCHIL